MAGLFEVAMLPTQAVRRACPRTLLLLRRRSRLLSTEGTGGKAQTSGPGSSTNPETVASRLARREKRQAQAAAAPTEAAKAGTGQKAGGGTNVGKIIGMAALGTSAYALFRAQEEGSDLRKWYDAQAAGEDGPAFSESLDAFLRSSVLGGVYVWLYEALARPFIEPSRTKLLPDWHSLPGVPPDSIAPPTLILDLEDTLVHATWDPKFGWRYVKRPGADQFLAEMAKYFELVIFTSAPFGVVDQVVNSLDKNMVIPHRLYKDSTRFHRGKHVKDLTYLNRDLRHVITVDDDPDNFQFQPHNGIRIKPYTDINDKTDRSLDRLRKLLVAMIAEGVSDFPAVLRRFPGMDADQIADKYDRLVREAKMMEEEKRRKGLGGLLRGATNMKTRALPLPPSSDGPKLSAKDIVGGVSTFDEKAEEALHAGPSGPVKKGRWFGAYMAQRQELQEDTQRRLEHWQKQQQKREEEARRQAQAAAR